MRGGFADATIVVVAHRLDAIMDFERIALLSWCRSKELSIPSALLLSGTLGGVQSFVIGRIYFILKSHLLFYYL
jgi:hypothetical protein